MYNSVWILNFNLVYNSLLGVCFVMCLVDVFGVAGVCLECIL